ncbi:uncharacterized protein TRIVIDRAFT_111399 [Trichoderma virens Gv29-8]|uniref:Uncharacterized protein n=1 Tax=Hypocrea virens (strain Gv29-8 / FGSC 10586) TaxID=413071 RepID=G9N911_HYPVG|nr:uncharacterized protein TRIVIDRAFT_111399 [Trichoderma virens Gv29-8]EHK16433.1 hypothetical protein TRIVIDRAFT_111399 [Trichoderma virens Gv29-8]UKZ52186.1 hypothetical protein TrVGV298_005961 [Trichoderma virens]
MSMTLNYFIAIALATSSLASALHSTTPTRRFSLPVQPTAFPDDPALTTPRPLVILTPSESDFDDVESTLSLPLTAEDTTVPFQDIDPTETVMPIPFTPSVSFTSPSSSSSASFAPSTAFASSSSSSSTPLTNHAERRVASSSSPSLTTITGTHATKPSSTSNPASVPTAFANAAVGLIAIVGLAMAL